MPCPKPPYPSSLPGLSLRVYWRSPPVRPTHTWRTPRSTLRPSRRIPTRRQGSKWRKWLTSWSMTGQHHPQGYGGRDSDVAHPLCMLLTCLLPPSRQCPLPFLLPQGSRPLRTAWPGPASASRTTSTTASPSWHSPFLRTRPPQPGRPSGRHPRGSQRRSTLTQRTHRTPHSSRCGMKLHV